MTEPAPSVPRVYRHRWPTRLWHWLNVVVVAVMLMSGLMIFNAHPRLYWGEYGADPDPAWLDLSGGDGIPFPGWITLPSHYSLADARLWHLAFAWLLAVSLVAYLGWSVVSRHVRRDLVPQRAELTMPHLWREVADHARLRFPTGASAARYGILQKIAYAVVLFILLPLMVLTGLAMSPGMDAGYPVLTALWGGRQSARSVHFLCAAVLVAFVVVHLAMVLLSGPINQLSAMLTGWYRLPPESAR